jgi:hypothetical protein
VTRVKHSLPMSVMFQDRIRAIAKAKNMTMTDVLMILINIGLDTTQDLELYPVKPWSES